MMLRLGAVLGPRPVRTLPQQPVPMTKISLSVDNVEVPVTQSGDELTITLPGYAGVYTVKIEDLAKGPVCLVPPVLGPATSGEPLIAMPGLWAYDAELGHLGIEHQWLADGNALEGQTGLDLAFDIDLEARPIVYAEIARQTSQESVMRSTEVNWPLSVVTPPPAPEPEWIILSDQRVTLDKITPDSGMIHFSITEPAAYVGDYVVDAAALAEAPVCLVPPSVTGAATDGATLTAAPGLWVSLSEEMTCTAEWLRNQTGTGNTHSSYLVQTAQDAASDLIYQETATDSAGMRRMSSNPISIAALVVDDAAMPVWLDATGGYAGLATAEADGSVTVTTKSGNKAGSPRVYFEVVPGTTYQLETAIDYGNATRVIGRLSDETGNTSSLNVTVFDVARQDGQTQMIRSDSFTPATGRMAMHYIFIMGTTGTARILPETRVKKVS